MPYAGTLYSDDLYAGSAIDKKDLSVQSSHHGLISSRVPIISAVIVLQWDQAGDKKVSGGVDRGVLYLTDGRVIPWNGLISVTESPNKDQTQVYYDGMKVNTLVTAGEYTGVIKAFTYPEEFSEIEGSAKLTDGVFIGGQLTQSFGLSYRTFVGDDVSGVPSGYKIHILYNVIAVPKDKAFTSFNANPNLVEFEWDINAIPEDIDGFSPSAHIIIDSTDLSPTFLQQIEGVLYGSDVSFASLPPMPTLIEFLRELSQALGTLIIQIVDNFDGTWTATTALEDIIIVNDDGSFEIINANATFAGDEYQLSDTYAN